jgi:hypothetical protein
MRDFDPTASEYITSGYLETSRPGRFAKFHDPVTAMAGATIGSSIIGGSAAKRAASTAANAQLESARMAAEAAKFRPYAITSGFGKSMFDTENDTASYELDPQLAAYRDQLYGLSQQGMGNINLDTTQAAQNYYNQQQDLMAGGRGAEDIALRQQQLQGGRIGLGLSGASQGAGAGTGFVNPEQYQMQLARAQTDQQLAANSDQMARGQLDSDITRATGLFNTGAGVEQLGQSTLTMGADIGNKQAAGQNTQASALLQGGMGAAQANLAGGLGQAQMYGQLGKSLGGMFAQPKTPNYSSQYTDPYSNYNMQYE